MVKFGKGEISAIDIIRVSKDPNFRTGTTPFGRVGAPTRYGGDAVDWKGKKKMENESLQTYLDRLSDTNDGVAKGLGNAIRESAAHTEKGVCLVALSDGDQAIMPAKSAYTSLGKEVVIRVTRKGKTVERRKVRVLSIVKTADSAQALLRRVAPLAVV